GSAASLAKNRCSCGPPAVTPGSLDRAVKLAMHNPSPLSAVSSGLSRPPILFLEPSCWSMFVEDYPELKIESGEKIANRCFMFEKFVDDLLEQEPAALQFKHSETTLAIHAHCHAKSIINPAFMRRLAERL